jgi:hypothetical protein
LMKIFEASFTGNFTSCVRALILARDCKGLRQHSRRKKEMSA